MPCRGPTEDELRAESEAIRLKKEKEEAAAEIVRKAQAFDRAKEEMDYITEMMCRILGFAETKDIRSDIGPSGGTWADDLLELHPGLPKWWSDHKARDEKRKAIEAAEAEVKSAQDRLKRLREG